MMVTALNLYLLDLTLPRLTEWLTAQGEPAYRAKQVYRHIYQTLSPGLGEMTDLPLSLRHHLARTVSLDPLQMVAEQASADGLTLKALFELPDGEAIESVLMLYGDEEGEARQRRTVCLSTQVGCAMNCVFCATGQGGWKRDLSAGEILGQVLYFARRARREDAAAGITNVIFAGMGEPLANYDAVWEAIERLNDPAGFGLGARHVTVSTAGWVPGIQRLAAEKLQVGLAVSLHASDDALRSRLMPINRRYPVSQLMAACRAYVEATGRRISFEYVLISGVNASLAQARKLAALLRGMLCHVNLIPLNPVPGSGWAAPGRLEVQAYQAALAAAGIPTSLRLGRGSDIQAACGQLRCRLGSAEAS